MLLSVDDLPIDARYYLPGPGWLTPHRNSEIISGWGVEEGREYLETSGRIDGWIVSYRRGTSTVTAPETVYNNVVIYQSVDGPKTVIEGFSHCMDRALDYTELQIDFLVGQWTQACISRETQPNGRTRVWIVIEFVYRNYYHLVAGWGWEEEVEVEYLKDVAESLLVKLEAEPLFDNVAFRP